MKKIETHCHSNPISTCSRQSAEILADRYAKCGFDAVTLSNHYSDSYRDCYGASFDEWLNAYIAEYRRFADACGKNGIEGWLGAEVTLFAPYSQPLKKQYSEQFLRDNYADYILIGVTEQFLRETPDLCRLDQKELYSECKKHGVLLFQAHPFRSAQGHSPRDLDYLDGLEINGCCGFTANPLDVREEEINRIADERNLIVIAGGDTHYDWHKLQTATFVGDEVRSSTDLADYLRVNRRPKYTISADDPTAADRP